MKSFSHFFTLIFFLTIQVLPTDVFGGRNEGINVQYECLGGNDYLVTVHLFRDCAEFTSTPAFLDVYFTSTCETLGFIELDLMDSQEVSQLCPDSLPSSSCNGGTLPGVNLSVFSGVVNLPPCTDWQVIVAEQNRASVLNLIDPFGDSRLHVEAFLNNVDAPCNSSPQLGLLALPFVCVNNDFFYNLTFNDPDGDSLVYSLTPAITSVQADMPLDMPYEPGYSPTAPIDNLTFDSETGQMNMTPTTEGKYTIVVEVKEYRDGVLIGTVYFDFNVIVIPCAVPPPTPLPGTLEHVSGGGYPISDNQISICAGDDFCLELDFVSTDPILELTVSADIAQAIPGATFVQSGLNPATIEFCGTIPDDFTGGDFVISAIDNFCSIYGQAFYAVQFVLREPMSAGPDTTICAGESVQLFAENDTSYTWFDLDGNLIPTGPDFSCNPCADPLISTDTTRTYIVQGAYDGGICPPTDTVMVTVPLNLDIEVTPETCFEDDGIIDITVLTGSGDYTVVWADDPTNALVRTDLNEGPYSVTITDNIHGCSVTRNFELENLIFPDANAGGDDFSCGMTYQLGAIPSFGETLWTTADPELAIADPASPVSELSASGPGLYELIWTENDGDGCVDSDTLQIEFFDQPTAQVTAVDTVCGLEVELATSSTNGSPAWTLSSNVIINNPLADTVLATADAEGLEEMIYQTINGPCVAADTAMVQFIEMPIANAGEGVIVCGDEINLFATASVGTGVWFLPDEVIPFGTPVGPSLEISTTDYGFYDLIWQETNQGYCQDRDTIEVGFIEQPIIQPMADTTICGPSADISAEVNTGELFWDGDPELSLSDPSQALVEVSADLGSYELRLTADNGYGCITADTLNLTFYEQPTLASSVTDTLCGFEAELESSLEDFDIEWSSDDLQLSSATDPQVVATASAEGVFEVSLVVDNQSVCFDTTVFSLSFFEQPEVLAQADFSVCGLNAEISSTPSIGDLTWTTNQIDGAFADPISTTTDFSVTSYGEATAIVTEENGPCPASDSITVSFEPSPEITDTLSACTGVDATWQIAFTALGDYGSGFEVIGIDGSFTADEFLSDPIPSGTLIEFTLSNNTICVPDSFSGSHDCPVISFSGELGLDTIRACGDDTAPAIQVTPPVLDGNDVLKYVLHDGTQDALGNILAWSDEPSFVANESTPINTVLFIAPIVGNPAGNEIDLNHPQVSIGEGQPVIYLPTPAVAVFYDEIICPTDTAVVPFNFAGNLPQSFAYSFNGVESTIDVNAPSIELAFTDSGVVEPLLTSSQYCDGEVTGTAQIAYHPEPALEYDWQEEICQGDTSLLTLSPSGSGPFQLQLNDANGSDPYLLPGDTSLALTIGGSYTLTNFADELCPVLDTFFLDLTVHPLPLVNAGEDLIICTGDTVQIGSWPSSGVLYNWSFDEALSSISVSDPTYAASNEGFYPQEIELILTATDINCTDRDTILIEVYPDPELQIFAPATVCLGDSLEAIGYGAEQLSWSPASLFSDPDSAETKLFTTASTEINLTGTNLAGCTSEVSWSVEVAPLPDVEIWASAVSGCEPLSVDFSVEEPIEGNTYQWSVNDQTTGQGNTLSREFSSGDYAIAVTATSEAGCVRTATLPQGLTVNSVTANFSFFPERPSITDPKVTFSSHSQIAELYFWSVDTLAAGTGEYYTFEFPDDIGGSYDVCHEVISPEGCVDSLCQTVTVIDDFFVYIPTAFTPDDDGLNDLFYPQLSRIDVAEYHFWITNRNGRVVFDTSDPEEKWNGSENNSGYYGPADLYQWHLSAKPDFNLEERFYTGKVMVIR